MPKQYKTIYLYNCFPFPVIVGTVAFAGYGCPLQADIPVFGMMEKLQAEYPERRDELVKLLGIDLQWRMHQVSDGQRRRVQIFLGLIRPFKILLLDEVTVSLDVVVRMVRTHHFYLARALRFISLSTVKILY